MTTPHQRAREIVAKIKRTIPLDPSRYLSHTDAFMDSEAEAILAAEVDAVLADKDAELARLTTIAEEQRLREYKLVESLQATKRELEQAKADLESCRTESMRVHGALVDAGRCRTGDLEEGVREITYDRNRAEAACEQRYAQVKEMAELHQRQGNYERSAALFAMLEEWDATPTPPPREEGRMKVAINVCFGGFRLSRAAVKRMAELQGRACYFFTHDLKNIDRYLPSDEKPEGRDLFFTAFDIPNPNEVLRNEKAWHDMSDAEKAASNKLYEQHQLPSGRFEDRADPLLIRVIEELGDLANGGCAKLKVVEIPDGIDYSIDEYDGSEHIAETHRTWG